MSIHARPKALRHNDRVLCAREDVRLWSERVMRPLTEVERMSIIERWQTNSTDGDFLLVAVFPETNDY